MTATAALIACRICGVATDEDVETRYGRTPAGQRNMAADFQVGTCGECRGLDTVTPGLAVRACMRVIGVDEASWPALSKVLAEMEFDPAAVLFERTGTPRSGPQRKAFAHVPEEARAALRWAWAHVLADRVAATSDPGPPEPVGPPDDGPPACLACGVAVAPEWHGPLHTFGLTRGPDRVDGYVCPACVVPLTAAGAVGPEFLERAVMAAKGIDWVPRVRAWVATGLPPREVGWDWVDVEPPARTLDPITALLEQVADLTERVEALERGAAG